MKIAFITSHINRSTQWNWFSEELNDRKIEHIHIIINEKYPILADDLKAMGVKVYYLRHDGVFSIIRNFFKTIWYIRKEKITLVHTEMPMGNFIGQLAAFFTGIKMRVTTCENTTWAFDFRSKKQLFIDRLTYRLAKKVIALTTEAQTFLLNVLKVPQEKVSVIHHSLKAQEYLSTTPEQVAALRKELEIEDNIFLIGMVARFEYWKGHKYAIEAFARLIKEYPNLRLYIFGSKGESFNSIMEQISEYKLEKYIKYKGFISNNIALFHLFDVHLHVPIRAESETFGINIMEGMISGCAQVLTLSGISCFTARKEENCLVVDYCSSVDIYIALKRLIEDPELGKRLGQNAKADALKYFQYEEKVKRHLELYENLRKELGL